MAESKVWMDGRESGRDRDVRRSTLLIPSVELGWVDPACWRSAKIMPGSSKYWWSPDLGA